MSYHTWLDRVDRVVALMTEGRLHDDLPAYDWREAWAWGEQPERAAAAAIGSDQGCTNVALCDTVVT